jgi:hypothetical protein
MCGTGCRRPLIVCSYAISAQRRSTSYAVASTRCLSSARSRSTRASRRANSRPRRSWTTPNPTTTAIANKTASVARNSVTGES